MAQYSVIIGLGKTGFSCVQHLLKNGKKVAVVDNRSEPPYLEKLRTQYPSVPLTLGTFASPYFAQAQEIILSPGISLLDPALAPEIEPCLKRGVSIIGDIELFVRAARAPIVAITGSNGKSTVTTLVGEMAKEAGIKVGVGGNLGTPALDLLDDEAKLYVLELSSFQLEATKTLKAAAASVLNITPDHLDRYASFEDYCAAKWAIYKDCKTAIINRDDEYSAPPINTGILKDKSVISFGLGKPIKEKDFGSDGNYLLFGEKKLLAIAELKIKGLHQVANALAALALGQAVNLPMEAMLEALKQFKGLAHRCQWVGSGDGVEWYNDSKGTNVGATKAAVEGLGADFAKRGGKIILIAGGLGKNADFTYLREVVSKYVRAIILIGKDAEIIEHALNGCCALHHANSMQEAVIRAAEVAKKGDAVLLSPACASFDMFRDFEHRGDVFTKEVLELLK